MLTLFSFRFRRFSTDTTVDRSLRHSVKDGLAYSVMSGSSESYFSAYALYLKASNEQIALLASVPLLIGSFAQLLSAWLGRHGRSRHNIILFGVTFQAMMLLPLIFLPFLLPSNAVLVLIGGIILFNVGNGLASPQWWSLMGDLVPERRRGRYFAMRTRFCSLVTFFTFLIAGTMLHAFSEHNLTAWGFVCLFIVAAIARLVSAYHLNRMVDPPGHVAVMESPFQRGLIQRLRGSKAAQFSVFFAAIQCSVAVASPFFTVYMLKELKLSYLEYTIVSATMIITQFLTLPRWGRVSDVFGNRVVLMFCGSLIPLMPLLWLVSTSFWYLVAIQMLGGFAWAGFTLSSGNFIYELVPAGKRATYLAMHNGLTGVAVVLGALLGGYLSEHLPQSIHFGEWRWHWFSALYGVFVLSALLRAAVVVYFLPRIQEIREVRSISRSEIFSRVVRLKSRRRLAISLSRMRKHLTTE